MDSPFPQVEINEGEVPAPKVSIPFSFGPMVDFGKRKDKCCKSHKKGKRCKDCPKG